MHCSLLQFVLNAYMVYNTMHRILIAYLSVVVVVVVVVSAAAAVISNNINLLVDIKAYFSS